VPRKVNLSKTLKQDTKKVFEQIANFENYSKYIPGCSSAQVLERNKNHEVGELKFDFLLRKYSITSKNILLDNKIHIEQIDGPFEFFKGEWIINKIKDSFLLDNLLPDQAINLFCEGAMEAFIKRLETTEEN
jgi:ribosome-associated toxin RatA of RatAB toxin-antitoxin module